MLIVCVYAVLFIPARFGFCLVFVIMLAWLLAFELNFVMVFG